MLKRAILGLAIDMRECVNLADTIEQLMDGVIDEY
jgi:hypothetical protein